MSGAVKVFIADYESDADLVVYRASYESQVRRVAVGRIQRTG